MPTVHIHESTSVPPDRFVAALTDFGPGRDEIFRNSHAKVHESGDTWADVTEGASVGWAAPLRLVAAERGAPDHHRQQCLEHG
jgi:hypothetical protein